ncbi:hypothetical protein TRVL_02137 [Trypanosoma vivax]|nr:hypothetical protein TRVL_02137 [Trypanosoma vivax]
MTKKEKQDARRCDGCGGDTSSFQCPLCQAELVSDRGFFCSQECFAAKWSEHRSTFHKSGIVRAKQPREQEPAAEADARKGKRSRREKCEAQESQRAKTHALVPWTVLRCDGVGAGVNPPLEPGVPRAVIGSLSEEPHVVFWSAADAASHHIAAELTHERDALTGEKESSLLTVLVIAAHTLAAHAMGWAARCHGLSGVVHLVVNPEVQQTAVTLPSACSNAQQRVVITTQEIARTVYSTSSVAAWLPTTNILLITLPGVADAVDFQTVHTRALFFINGREPLRLPEEKCFIEEDIAHRVAPLASTPVALHSLFGDALGASPIEKDGTRRLFDNDVSTSLARGDLAAALQHLVRLYSTQSETFEEILANSLTASMGAVSVAHAHHVLAYVARQLVDHSGRFATSQAGSSLKNVALRVVSRVVAQLPPITASEDSFLHNNGVSATASRTNTKGGTGAHTTSISGGRDGVGLQETIGGVRIPPPSALEREQLFNFYSTVPNLQLQATLCYLYPHASHATVDALGEAWGIKKVVPGPGCLQTLDKVREACVQRIQGRYTPKLGTAYANYLTVLMHFLYDAVAEFSLELDDVQSRTLWSLTLEWEVGSLPDFLSNCFLLHKQTNAQVPSHSRKAPALSSRQLPPSRADIKALRRSLPVRAGLGTGASVRLQWIDLPLTERRGRAVQQLQEQALEEILMAMPRKPRPMYVGEVGNLVGKWSRFNARYDGALGASLLDFLMQHPKAFRVAGTLVTRRKAGVSEPVRIRYDDDSGRDDDDGDEQEESNRARKARDRALLTGAGKGGKKAAGRSCRHVRESELRNGHSTSRALTETTSQLIRRQRYLVIQNRLRAG